MVSLPGLSLLFGLAVMGTGATKIASMDDGSEFTKCVNTSHFETKSADDDITLVDKLADGCCPPKTVPGTILDRGADNADNPGFKTSMIVCGLMADGSVSVAKVNNKCEYKCYIDQRSFTCMDGKKQRLNGCCASTTANGKTTTAKPAKDCKTNKKVGAPDFSKSFSSNNKVNWCQSYHKDNFKQPEVGTKDKTDDLNGGKLQTGKIRTYALCPSATPAAGASASASASGTSGTTGGNGTSGSKPSCFAAWQTMAIVIFGLSNLFA